MYRQLEPTLMNHCLRLFIVSCGCLFSLLSPTLGRAEAPSDSVHTLREVVVTARTLSRDVIPAQSLTGRDLQRLSAVSVADALRFFAGIQIKDYGGVGGLKTVNVRSMGSQHVGVFYDGLQLGNAQNGQIDLGRFSLDNMESVSIYNGQKSSILQPAKNYASASALYMTTRRPSFEGAKQDNLKVSLKVGSFSTLNPSVLWEHRLSRSVDLSVSSEYMYTTGRYRFRYRKKDGYDTTAIRHNGDVRALRAEVGLFGRIAEGDWKAKAYLYNSQRGYPGAFVREEPGKFRHEDRQWDNNFLLQGSLRKAFSPHYTALFSAKYAFDYLHYLSDPRLDVTTMYVNNHYYQQEGYFSSAHDLTLTEAGHLALSNDIQWNTLRADLYNFAYPTRLSVLTALATDWSLGGLKAQASLLHTYIHDWVKALDQVAPSKQEWTPTIVLSYKPFPSVADLSLRGFYKRIFRMPTFNDLYYTFIGNKYLKPEYTTQYDLGLVYTKDWGQGIFRHLELQVDGYLNYVDDKIIAMPTSNQFQWTMVNLGHVRIRGIDVSLESALKLDAFTTSARLTYTYQRAQDLTDPSDSYYGDQIPYIPWHSGSAILAFAWRGWDVNYSFIYTGERYNASANIRENHVQPWYTHDLSLSKSVKLYDKTFRLAAEVNNLLNQQYEVVRSYPMPGTSVKLKLEWLL